MKRALRTVAALRLWTRPDDVGYADMSRAHSPPLRDNMKESDWKVAILPCLPVGWFRQEVHLDTATKP